jgi:sugar lactone lactonase YvrE
MTLCSSGSPVCDGSQNQPDGTACGPSLVCRSGSCQTSPLAIVVASGDGQHALPNQPLPQLLSVAIKNVLTQVNVAGQTVTVTPPAGAQVNRTTATTDPTGVATFVVTLGRAVGTQTFTVGNASAYPATVSVSEIADAPADGTVIPLVDSARVVGSSPITGPGPAVLVNQPGCVAVASTGDVYLGDASRCQVRKLSPAGVVTVVAGTNCAASSGDGGLAVNATFYSPRALALDEANQLLYVADATGNRVRAVDLRTGLISTVAGTGTTGAAPYGDGGPATQAQLSSPNSLALGPGPTPMLFILDALHALVRRVDPVTGLISTVVTGGGPACSANPVGIQNFYNGTGSSKGAIATDAQGRLFVAGTLCGTVSGGNQFQGIVRVEADGTLAHVAGSTSGGLGGGPATGAGIGWVNDLAFDHATNGSGVQVQNLFFADGGKGTVVRIDGVTGRISLAGGIVGTATSTGDFGQGSAATFNVPWALAFVPGRRDLVVAESTGNVVRLIAGAGSAQATQAALARAGGDGQTVYVDQTLPTPLSASLTEGAGTPVAGFQVRFALDPTGNGGGWLSSSSSSTTAGGIAATTARVGLTVGVSRILASFDDLHGDPIPGSPVTFTANAGPPPSGTVFAVAGDSHVNAPTPVGVPGPGAVAQISDSYGSVLLPDRSLAFTSGGTRVLRLAPDGTLSVLAGGGSLTTDGVPATSLLLNGAQGLALSADGSTLYVGEASNVRIRAVNLATGMATTVAGTGTNACPGTGDGGLATAAQLCYPGSLTVAGGSLYVGSTSTNISTWGEVRRVGIDPANSAEYGKIFAFLPRGASSAGQTTGLATATSATGPATAWGCGGSDRCSVAVDPTGVLYVSGNFFGTGFEGGGNASAPGIVRVDPVTGALTRIAGRTSALAPSPGLTLERAGFSYPPTIAFDAAGNLWVASRSSTANQDVVGWIAPDATTGHVEPSGIFNQVGQTTSLTVPPAGAYTPTGSAFFGAVWSITFTPDGHAFLTDQDLAVQSYSVRMIW